MPKKKKVLIIMSIVLVILMSFIGGRAYSKYVARVRGQGIAEIATWNFKVNGQEEQVQTIKLQSIYNNEKIINNKIAPGTKGKFDIVVDATGSNVAIDYNIDFTNETNKPTNLKFIYKNIKYNSITELKKVMSGRINANDEEKKKIFQIEWIWEYETGTTKQEISINDKIDTQNSKDFSNYTFDVIVSGTQVDPN